MIYATQRTGNRWGNDRKFEIPEISLKWSQMRNGMIGKEWGKSFCCVQSKKLNAKSAGFWGVFNQFFTFSETLHRHFLRSFWIICELIIQLILYCFWILNYIICHLSLFCNYKPQFFRIIPNLFAIIFKYYLSKTKISNIHSIIWDIIQNQFLSLSNIVSPSPFIHPCSPNFFLNVKLS